MPFAELRSAFMRLASPGRNTEGAPWLGMFPWLRGRVVRVYTDRAGKQPAFICDVAPTVNCMSTGDDGNVISGVAILQAGFGSLDETAEHPSGIVTLPEVGSIALCLHDGSRWTAIGFYSGPVQTMTETQFGDLERRANSYNPGFGTAANRVAGQPGWDLDDWAFGIEAGDQVMAKGNGRVKLGGRGLTLGADLVNCDFYRTDGVRQTRYAGWEQRAVGYWLRQAYHMGGLTTGQVWAQAKSALGFGDLPTVPPDASAYRAEVVEAGALTAQEKPYVVRQSGHVSKTFKDMGRLATQATPSGHTAQRETLERDFVVDKRTVVQPTSPDPATLREDELTTGKGYVVFDEQVDAVGSWRLRSGNRMGLPGGQDDQATEQMDFSLEYDAREDRFLLRLGVGGSEAFKLALDARNGAAVLKSGGSLDAEVGGDATVKAKTLRLEATRITLAGDVEVEGGLRVAGDVDVDARRDVTVGRVGLAKHKHPYTDDGSPAITRAPLPG